jgi:hypothetical protein
MPPQQDHPEPKTDKCILLLTLSVTVLGEAWDKIHIWQ